MSVLSMEWHAPVMLYHRVCNKSNNTGATCREGTAHLSGAPEITPDGTLRKGQL